MHEEINDNLIWLKCPFRVIRSSTAESPAAESSDDVICEAAGGFILCEAGKGQEAGRICMTCDIPLSLTHRHACLYLAPFHVFEGNQAKSYYGCRWRLDFKPMFFPENIDWCRACRNWFPRPPENLVFHQIEFSHRALELFLSPPSPYIHPALKALFDKLPEEKKEMASVFVEKNTTVRGSLKHDQNK